jgi:hypothetical protein
MEFLGYKAILVYLFEEWSNNFPQQWSSFLSSTFLEYMLSWNL